MITAVIVTVYFAALIIYIWLDPAKLGHRKER